MHISRRDWILAAGCWTEVLRAQDAGSKRFAWFDVATAAEIRAIAAQIIPDDDTPGAERAGVVWFIDGALAGYDKDKQELVQQLKELQERAAAYQLGKTSVRLEELESKLNIIEDRKKGLADHIMKFLKLLH